MAMLCAVLIALAVLCTGHAEEPGAIAGGYLRSIDIGVRAKIREQPGHEYYRDSESSGALCAVGEAC